MKIATRLLAVITLSVIGGGCGPIFYLSEPTKHREVRKSGYELCHLLSCGPQALSSAFKRLGINKTPLEIGKEIQDDDHTRYRTILSLIDHRFCSITCPQELKTFCKKYNITIKKIKSLDNLTKEDTAIALIKGPNDLLDWHWMTYPTHKKLDILRFFEYNTQIKGVYLLQK
jgi:hypothetical protein